MRKLYILGLIALAVLIIGLAWAEQITLSTYYPAPYGVYREMNVHYLDFKTNEYDQSIGDMPADEEARICYDSEADQFKYSDGSNWLPFGGGNWTLTGTDLYTNDSTQAGINWNVGIGTTNPVFNLDVRGANSNTWNKPSLGVSDGNDGYVMLHGNAVTPAIIWDSDNRLRFGVGGSSMANPDASWSEKMTILANGNVGIGMPSPTGKLHVRNAAGNAHTRFVYPTGSNSGENWLILAGGAGTFNLVADDSRDLFRIFGGGTTAVTPAFAIKGGNVGICVPNLHTAATIDYKLEVNGTAGKPGGGSWSDSSDIRLKKNVKTIEGALGKILRLHGVTYQWKEPQKHGNMEGTYMAMIAQEVEKVFPEWVGTDNEGYKTLGFIGFEALTVEAIRELKAENEALKARIEVLESKLNLGQ